jgi:hypothetical protein
MVFPRDSGSGTLSHALDGLRELARDETAAPAVRRAAPKKLSPA